MTTEPPIISVYRYTLGEPRQRIGYILRTKTPAGIRYRAYVIDTNWSDRGHRHGEYVTATEARDAITNTYKEQEKNRC